MLLPSLAHADALSAYGAGLAFFAMLMLGVTVLVVISFLIVLYSWPRWSGLLYVLRVPLLLLLMWARLLADYPGQVLNLLSLLVLLNGLAWVQTFRPRPIRLAGTLAILIGGIGIISEIFNFLILPPCHHAEYTAEPAPA